MQVDGISRVPVDGPVPRYPGRPVLDLLHDPVDEHAVDRDHLDRQQQPVESGIAGASVTRWLILGPDGQVGLPSAADVDAAVGRHLLRFEAVTKNQCTIRDTSTACSGVAGGATVNTPSRLNSYRWRSSPDASAATSSRVISDCLTNFAA